MTIIKIQFKIVIQGFPDGPVANTLSAQGRGPRVRKLDLTRAIKSSCATVKTATAK